VKSDCYNFSREVDR